MLLQQKHLHFQIFKFNYITIIFEYLKVIQNITKYNC